MQTLTFVGWMIAVSLGTMTLVWVLSLVLRTRGSSTRSGAPNS